jgi:hypothetical protein
MRNMAVVVLLIGLTMSESAFAMGCPYVIEVLNKRQSAANLLEIKSRISGMNGQSWKIVEDFKGQGGEVLEGEQTWEEYYRTDALCTTTKYDFLLKFADAKHSLDVKTLEKIQVNQGETVTFTLGK